MSIKKYMNQTGDTIVEVLIAIAVATAILSSAYAIVNHTAKSQQQTSEHTDALKLAESQLELLRQRVKAGGTTHATSCFKPDGTYVNFSPGPCTLPPPQEYITKITKDPSKFTINISWKGINSSTDSVELLYKVY